MVVGRKVLIILGIPATSLIVCVIRSLLCVGTYIVQNDKVCNDRLVIDDSI